MDFVELVESFRIILVIRFAPKFSSFGLDFIGLKVMNLIEITDHFLNN